MFPTATTADGRKCSIHNTIDRRGRNGNSAIQQESQAGSHEGMKMEMFGCCCVACVPGGTDASEKETLKQIQTLQRVISMTGELSSI